MGKKILVFFLYVLLCKFSYSQIITNDKLIWECFDTTNTIKFTDLPEINSWAANSLPFSIVQNYFFKVRNKEVNFYCVNGCSGVRCFKVHCFVRYGNDWFLTCTANTRLNNSFKEIAFKDSTLVFKSEVEEIGFLHFDEIMGNYKRIKTGNNLLLFHYDGSDYLSDIDNSIFYKTDTLNYSQRQGKKLRCENGTIYNDNKIVMFPKKYGNNIKRGYFNAQLSNDEKTIICELRTAKKRWEKTILPSEIVEIDIVRKQIKTIFPFEGLEPYYSPFDNKLILCHNDDKYYQVFERSSNCHLFLVITDFAAWIE